MAKSNVHRSDGYYTLGMAFLDSGNYIAVNRTLVRKFGLNCSVIIGELASEAMRWANEGKLKDGWFYSTVENLEWKTGLNQHFQSKAINELVDCGVLQVKYMGLPRKRHFRIDMPLLMNLVNDYSSTEPIANDETCPQLINDDVNEVNNQVATTNKSTNNKKNRAYQKFVPPKPEEVRAYMQGRGTPIDADSFCDYWESVGWMRGKTKMKDWKAAARQWAKNDARWNRRGETDADLEEYLRRLDF